MKLPISRTRRNESGAVILLLAVLIVVIILFVGLVIDIGFAYVTKANLSKAVDAACLSGIRNLAQGEAQARTISRSAFDLNYGTSGRDSAAPTVNIEFADDENNNKVLTVSATARINTFFIRVLPQWTTMDVAATARATRTKLIMTVVLDRSGSMNGNGGAMALPPAVDTFIDYFDDVHDRAAMTSFASHARVDVAMGSDFKTPIKNAVHAMPFNGGTAGDPGLTKGLAENNSVALMPREHVLKIAVFFTDGLANIVNDTLNCNGIPTRVNFGGHDSGTTVGFFDPATGAAVSCTGATQFPSAIDHQMRALNRQNVTADARFRAIQTANAMRAQGMIVYAIGLGDTFATSPANQDFLRQVANDPLSSTHVSRQEGEAVFAPTANDLEEVFQTIASKILFRLTQ